MGKDERKFTTLDIYTAAYLELNGVQANLEKSGKRVVFAFPLDKHLELLLNTFSSNASVPIADFIAILKQLKARMHAARGGSDVV